MSETLVLLPGMMCDERIFTPQIKSLSKDREVIVFPLDTDETIENIAKTVIEKSPEKFAVAGLSMGGIVAMEIIKKEPDRVTRLALLDTNHLAEKSEVSDNRNIQIEKVKNGQLFEVMKEEMKPSYLCDGPHKSRILDICMEMATTLGPKAFIRQSRALQTRPDQTKTLNNIKIPSLILCGESDSLCPPERHQLMHELIPNSMLKIISNAGHLPTLEQAELTTKALKEWLKIQ